MIEPSLDQLLVSKLSSLDSSMYTDTNDYEYKSVFLNTIIPDETNARYMPAKMISDMDAELYVQRRITKLQLVKQYDAECHVLFGKDCFINCLKYGSTEWKRANKTIESIVDLANNIAVSELIQVPTAYPVEDGYKLLTGHRRYFALVYVKGVNTAFQFKVYKQAPLLKKTKQFQENSSREDLPNYSKLSAFMEAQREIEALNQAKRKLGLKHLGVRKQVSMLGISMGAYDNYNVLTRYPSVVSAYELGLSSSFISTKKVILETERKYQLETGKGALNITDRRKINERLKSIIEGTPNADKQKAASFRLKPLNSEKSMKKLLATNVFDLDTGVDWDALDWGSSKDVKVALSKVICYLNDLDS